MSSPRAQPVLSTCVDDMSGDQEPADISRELEIEKLRGQITMLMRDNESLRRDNTTLIEDNMSLKSKHAHLRNEIGLAKGAMDAQTRTINSLLADLKTCRSEAESWKREVTKLETESNAEVKKLQDKCSGLRKAAKKAIEESDRQQGQSFLRLKQSEKAHKEKLEKVYQSFEEDAKKLRKEAETWRREWRTFFDKWQGEMRKREELRKRLKVYEPSA